MPIAQAAYEVLYEGRDPKLVVIDLMGRGQALRAGGILVLSAWPPSPHRLRKSDKKTGPEIGSSFSSCQKTSV